MESSTSKISIDKIQKEYFENSTDLIFIINLNKNYETIFVNRKQCKQYLNYSLDQLIGGSFLEFVHPKDRINFIDILNNGKRNNNEFTEIRLKTQKGNYIWFQITLNKITCQGKDKIFLILKDIRKQKIYEENLKENRERFRWLSENVPEIKFWRLLQPKKCISAVQKSQEMLEKVMDNIPHYVFWKDSDLNYLGCNSNFADLNELNDLTEINGKTNKDILLFKAKADFFESKERKIIETNRPDLNNNEILELPTGDKAFFNVSRIPLLGDNKEVIGILSMYQDITEHKLAEDKLRSSEKKYRNILENIKECYFEVNLNGDITFANDAFIELLGYKEEELMGMNYSSFCDKATQVKIYEKFNKVFRTEKSIKDFQYRAYNKKGDEVYVETSVNLRYDSEGNKIGFSGLLRIITEKFLLQQKLKKSEERYRLISENANDYITIINQNLRFEYINKEPYLMGLGYSKEELLGENCIEYLHQDDKQRAIKVLKKSFSYKKPGSAEIRFRHKTGKWIWLDVKGRIFIDTDNKPKALLISRDISERKKNEEKIRQSEEKLKKLNKQLEKKILERTKKLKESEEKFRTITEQSLLGISFVQKKKIIYANKALSSILGWKIEEMENLGMEAILDAVHPKDRFKFTKIMKEISKSSYGFTTQFSIRMLTKDKKTKHLDIFIRRIKYQGKPAGLISIVDITDRKEAELKLIESEKELKRKNKKLKKLDKLKTDFITMAAHELKTPLISISGYTDLILLRERNLKTEIKEDLKRILNNSKRLERYVNKLMDAMKIDAQKMEFNIKKTDINKIIKECIKDLRYQIKKKDINVSLELNDDIISMVDPFRISQVFSNLITNAIKFTPRKGKIQIMTKKRKKNKILCCVKDNGVGLKEDEINKLFGKFVMLQKDIEKFSKGSGLGLYISKGIIEGHGGEIWAESKGKNMGSNFKFTLPLN